MNKTYPYNPREDTTASNDKSDNIFQEEDPIDKFFKKSTIITENLTEKFIGTDINWNTGKDSQSKQDKKHVTIRLDVPLLVQNEGKCDDECLQSNPSIFSADSIVITSKDESPQTCVLDKNSAPAKKLSEYIAILAGTETIDIHFIEIAQRNGKAKKGKKQKNEYWFELNIFGSKKEKVSKISLPEARKEKIYHNIDKSLLEYFTTKTFLKKITIPKPEIKLREIYDRVPGKWKITEKEKKALWKSIENDHVDVIKYFRQMIHSEYFLEYLIESFFKNKIKKTLNEKLENLRDFLVANKQFLVCAKTYEEFKAMVRAALKGANIKPAAVVGEAVEQIFCRILFERKSILFEDGFNLIQKLKGLFKEAVIEANIFKVIWMVVQKEQVFEMVKRLAITRLIGRFLQVKSKHQNGVDHELMKELEESGRFSKNIKKCS